MRVRKVQMELLVAFLAVVVSVAKAQIPIPCATLESLTARTCCPVPDKLENAGPCGVSLGRGSCQPIAIPDSEFDSEETDVRMKWPIQYFNSTCACAERYGGVDCGECSYAYNDGTSKCAKRTVRARKSIAELSDEDWKEYRDTLLQAQTSPSRYMVVTVNFTTDLQELVDSMVHPSVYHMFVWVHYMASSNTGKDYVLDLAHKGTGFPTWHRLLILWFERELQTMLGDHLFRFHYWNWLDPEQRDVPFQRDRLGDHSNKIVMGDLADGNWSLICWYDTSNDSSFNICNPNQPSEAQWIRCPNATLCQKYNSVWPTYIDYHEAVSIQTYDISPYNAEVQCRESFRSLMEGFLNEYGTDCRDDPMCSVDKDKNMKETLKLHNVIHNVLGLGSTQPPLNFDKQGVIGDGAASPNDPIFINHHTIVDCMLEVWIQRNKDHLDYPTTDRVRYGHRAEDYIVPFIPLYKQKDMLVSADNFGYSCTIPETSDALRVHIHVVLVLCTILVAVLVPAYTV